MHNLFLRQFCSSLRETYGLIEKLKEEPDGIKVRDPQLLDRSMNDLKAIVSELCYSVTSTPH